MLLGERKRIQRSQASRTPSVFDAQISSDASHELGRASLHWQRAAQEEQVPSLHRLNVGAEMSRWTRQVYAEVSQTLFGTDALCIHGHYWRSIDISRASFHHRPRCAPPSTCSTSPVTWLASVR